MNPRIKALLSQALDLDSSQELTLESGAESIPQWDSMAQVMIASELEQQFGLRLSVDDVVKLLTVRAVIRVLERHGAELS